MKLYIYFAFYIFLSLIHINTHAIIFFKECEKCFLGTKQMRGGIGNWELEPHSNYFQVLKTRKLVHISDNYFAAFENLLKYPDNYFAAFEHFSSPAFLRILTIQGIAIATLVNICSP